MSRRLGWRRWRCRRPGISPATFRQWKWKFGGLEVSEARRLRPLEEENNRLIALNHARAAEEARGEVRRLRPEYQIPQGRCGANGRRRDGARRRHCSAFGRRHRGWLQAGAQSGGAYPGDAQRPRPHGAFGDGGRGSLRAAPGGLIAGAARAGWAGLTAGRMVGMASSCGAMSRC